MQALEADVVIVTSGFPRSGERCFRDARRRRSDVPFLFMTAYSDIDQAVRLMKAGAGDYVTKPFEMRTLLRRLSDIAPSAAAKSRRTACEMHAAKRRRSKSSGR